MAAIGAISCQFVRGHVPRWRTRVETWQVPGINGHGAKKSGKGKGAFRLVAEATGTNAEIDVWIAAIEDLVGTIVTITNDWGDSFLYCLITKLGQPIVKRARVGVSNCKARLVVEGVRKWV